MSELWVHSHAPGCRTIRGPPGLTPLRAPALALRRRQGAARAIMGCPDLIMGAAMSDPEGPEGLTPAGTWSVGPTLALQ